MLQLSLCFNSFFTILLNYMQKTHNRNAALQKVCCSSAAAPPCTNSTPHVACHVLKAPYFSLGVILIKRDRRHGLINAVVIPHSLPSVWAREGTKIDFSPLRLLLNANRLTWPLMITIDALSSLPRLRSIQLLLSFRWRSQLMAAVQHIIQKIEMKMRHFSK